MIQDSSIRRDSNDDNRNGALPHSLAAMLLSAGSGSNDCPSMPSRPPGPQVNAMQMGVMLVDSFEQLWDPKRGPEEMLLHRYVSERMGADAEWWFDRNSLKSCG